MNQHYQDLLIDVLLDYGFTLDEALRLIELHERVERERREEAARAQRESWLGTSDTRCLWN